MIESPKDESAERFDAPATAVSHFSWIRTRLALEGTLMSWIRTSVSLIGFGFTVVQFFDWLRGMQNMAEAAQPVAPRYLGLALIGAGVLVLLISAWQYRRAVQYLWSTQFRSIAGVQPGPMAPIFTQTPAMAVTVVLILIGLFAFGAVVLRMV